MGTGYVAGLVIETKGRLLRCMSPFVAHLGSGVLHCSKLTFGRASTPRMPHRVQTKPLLERETDTAVARQMVIGGTPFGPNARQNPF